MQIEARLAKLRTEWKEATPERRGAIKIEADRLKKGLTWRRFTDDEILERNVQDKLL